MTNAAILRVVTPTAGKPTWPGAATPAKNHENSIQVYDPVATTRRNICRKAITLQNIGKLLLIYALFGEFAIGMVSVWAKSMIGTIGSVILCVVSLGFGLAHILLSSYLFGSAASLYAQAQKLRKGGKFHA